MVEKKMFLLPHEAEEQRADQARRREEFARQYVAPCGEEERLPIRPFATHEDGRLIFNAHHVGKAWQAAHRPAQYGTSIFLNFTSSCRIHQAGLWGFEEEGIEIGRQIANELWARCEKVVNEINPGFAFADLADDEVDMLIRPEPAKDCDNGEIHIHFKRRVLRPRTAAGFACSLFESVHDNPISVMLGNVALPIVFYGSGFRLT